MYQAGTILSLKSQREPDKETNEPFAYNRVEVIGPSIISHPSTGEWSGAAAAGVILRPLANFGGVIDEPLGKVQALYTVESVPEQQVVATPTIRVVDSGSAAAGATPEEVFAEKAPGEPAAPGGHRRARTSPLVDPRPKASDGPLGPVPANE